MSAVAYLADVDWGGELRVTSGRRSRAAHCAVGQDFSLRKGAHPAWAAPIVPAQGGFVQGFLQGCALPHSQATLPTADRRDVPCGLRWRAVIPRIPAWRGCFSKILVVHGLRHWQQSYCNHPTVLASLPSLTAGCST